MLEVESNKVHGLLLLDHNMQNHFLDVQGTIHQSEIGMRINNIYIHFDWFDHIQICSEWMAEIMRAGDI